MDMYLYMYVSLDICEYEKLQIFKHRLTYIYVYIMCVL